jgi:SAM-dependent methyltransferase
MNKEISDYDKYNYDYEKYWENPDVNRDYEDQAEKIVIRKLLKKVKTRNWFCDLGAGFGRLFDTYGDHFFNIILADYSIENLKKAQGHINKKTNNQENKESSLKNPNVFFVAANAYHLPFKPAVLDCLLSVRMMHHMEDPAVITKEISRVIRPKGKLVLEYANKRHFFEVIKAVLKKSKMSPFSLEPKKRGGDLFYNFHPKYIKDLIQNSEFRIQKLVSTSNLRHGFFKKTLGTKVMLLADKIFQPVFNLLKFGPSIFVFAERNQKGHGDSLITQYQNISDLFICPKCQSDDFMILKHEIRCKKCEKIYPVVDGIYDFRVE